MDGATHSLIEGNTVRDSGYAFGVDAELGDRWPSHGLVIRNNLAHRNYAGIKVGTWYSDTDGSRVYDVLVINNTVVQCDYGLVVRPYVRTSVAWKNNLVARALVSFVNTGRWAVGTVDYNLYFGGGVGPDANVVTRDPRFVDADARNFSLGVGSPGIDAGDPATSAADAGGLDLCWKSASQGWTYRPRSVRALSPLRLLHVTTVPQALFFLRGQPAFMRAHGVEVHAVSSPGPELDQFSRDESVDVHAVEMRRAISPSTTWARSPAWCGSSAG